MSAAFGLTLKVWRQATPHAKGRFETYRLAHVRQHLSFPNPIFAQSHHRNHKTNYPTCHKDQYRPHSPQITIIHNKSTTSGNIQQN